jgi:exopolysaccharide production protein ExoQ
LATARQFSEITAGRELDSPLTTAEEPENIWTRASTWGLLLLLLYFALAGISPFANSPIATRVVATSSAGGVLVDRLGKLIITLGCLLFVLKRHEQVRRLCTRMKLVTSFPILALLCSPLSQLPTRTISSSAMLLAGILLLFYIVSLYSVDQILELLLVLGTGTIGASIVFALALPQYGRDLLGGHDTAWKGIFMAKNYLGNLALFFLTVAVAYRGRTSFQRFVRISQIMFCLIAIAFSRAATAYLLTAIYFAYVITMKMLRGFRKKDYFVLCILVFAVFATASLVIVVWPDFLFSLLGKDMTFTGRTQIWSAVVDSIAKRPLLGYGYDAFWLGLDGESYRIILAVSWELAQAQNGFLDVMLEMGFLGLAIVLLIFAFAFRDALTCLWRSSDDSQLRAVEWYLGIVILTLIYNLDESFLFAAKHLCSMIFLLACVGLRMECSRLLASSARRAGHRLAPTTQANAVR